MSGRHRDSHGATSGRALAVGPILWAWFLVLGMDLFFNAGLFHPLFDQAREPTLLPDESLFRRIHVAYAGLLAVVVLLAALIDRVGIEDVRSGATHGAGVGLGLALMGPVYLWTAVDLTVAFVAAAAVVVASEFAAAGAVLAAFKQSADASRTRRRVASAALGLAVVGFIVQNLWG